MAGEISDMQSDPQELASETTEKTYWITTNDKVVKNSVKITTTRSQPVTLSENQSAGVNRDRKLAKDHIIKTVEIDNDEDDAYDEVISFRYEANAESDFVLVTDQENVLVGLDDGTDLKILEKQSLVKKNELAKGTYVFTDEAGNNVTFIVEEYRTLD